MSTTAEKISRIRESLNPKPDPKKEVQKFPKDCVFCTDYKNYMGFDATSTEYNLSRMCDGIIQKAYCIEKNNEFPKVSKQSLCKLHDDKWLIDHSKGLAGFFWSAISRYEVVKIDDRNPIEVFQLLSDFDTMDFVLQRHYDVKTEHTKKEISAFEKNDPEKILPFGYNEVWNSIEKEFLANADYYHNYCRNALRKIGKKWIMSLDPKEFDSGYLKMLEEYGPNFGKGGIIYPANLKELKAKQEAEWKKEFEAWLERAESELGKGLVHSKLINR